jgi:hypothetical protein
MRLNSSFTKGRKAVANGRLPAIGIAVFGNEHSKDIQIRTDMGDFLTLPITGSPDHQITRSEILSTLRQT